MLRNGLDGPRGLPASKDQTDGTAAVSRMGAFLTLGMDR
jgi:hypothetical protein